jgi:hypothetical protein
MDAPLLQEVVLRSELPPQADLPLATEGVLRHVWSSRWGEMLIEVNAWNRHIRCRLTRKEVPDEPSAPALLPSPPGSARLAAQVVELVVEADRVGRWCRRSDAPRRRPAVLVPWAARNAFDA